MSIRAVVDTNVWISSLLTAGTTRLIVEAVAADKFTPVVAAELLEELARVARRPKFGISEESIERFLVLLLQKSTFVEIPEVAGVSRDPKDDVFLACAKVGKADYLVSGDKDLLDLHKHDITQIVTPARFLELLAEQP